MVTKKSPENILIFEHTFDNAAQKVSFDENTLKIGSLVFKSEHDQDCCENVYADFSVFKWHASDLMEMGIKRLEIKAVEDMGLVFFFYENQEWGDPRRVGVLVNCYNSQNGYYSSSLSLVICNGDKEQKIDVSEVVYNVIC